MSKPWYKSRTIAVQILTALAAILTFAAERADVLALPPEAVPAILLVLALVNTALRFITSEPIR